MQNTHSIFQIEYVLFYLKSFNIPFVYHSECENGSIWKAEIQIAGITTHKMHRKQRTLMCCFIRYETPMKALKYRVS